MRQLCKTSNTSIWHKSHFCGLVLFMPWWWAWWHDGDMQELFCWTCLDFSSPQRLSVGGTGSVAWFRQREEFPGCPWGNRNKTWRTNEALLTVLKRSKIKNTMELDLGSAALSILLGRHGCASHPSCVWLLHLGCAYGIWWCCLWPSGLVAWQSLPRWQR